MGRVDTSIEFDDSVLEDIKEAVNGVLTEGAQSIAEESQRQAPEETGALKDSCRVEAGEMSAEVKYETDYAAKVHEDIGARHRIGKAKFLEDPFNEKADGITQTAAAEIERIISR